MKQLPNCMLAVICAATMICITVGNLVTVSEGYSKETEEDSSTDQEPTAETLGSLNSGSSYIEETEATVTVEPMTEEETETQYIGIQFSDEEKLMLAKIAMAEAEGEDIKGKALVIRVVLNRVSSPDFPNSIKEVIFANNGKTYQFSPIRPGGRWWTTEPNEECWEAVELVQTGWDESQGALYFESGGKSKWHKTLKFLFKYGCHSFYTDKE